MNDASKPDRGRNAPRLVWMLAAIGLAAGAFTLALLTTALVDVQDARRSVAVARAHTETLVSALDRELDSARVVYRAVLAGNVVDRSAYGEDDLREKTLDVALKTFRNLVNDTALLESLDSFAPTISRIDQLRVDCGDWDARSFAIDQEFTSAEKNLASVLSTIKASVASAQGRARLHRIVRLRQLNAAAAKDTAARPAPSIRDLASDSDLPSIRRELADLEVLAQRLAGETNFDRFSDLKDNLFKASIDRLKRDFAKLERSGKTFLRNGSTQLHDFEIALFGAEFEIDEQHQTVKPGIGGLYNLVQERLMLRGERWQLAEAMEFELQAFSEHRQRLRERGDILNERLAARVEDALLAARSKMFIFGGICGVIFVFLAGTIARSINRQIRDMQRINRELDEAIVHANAASQAKSQFLATMSHEIRTPMNGVLGMTELLLQSGLSSEQHRLSEIAHQSAEGLLAVINDVLDFSKVEAGKLELESAPFCPRETIEEVTSLQAARAQTQGLELVFTIDENIPSSVVGDASRLRQILTNLLANAIKFTEEGEIQVSARVVETTATSVMLHVEVTDTGIGIAPEQQARLFSPFSQADSTMTRRYGGTGLGLAISKQLVELMDGEIGFESETGIGTTFWFTLILQVAGIIQPASPRNALRDHRILIVDDNRASRKSLHRRLLDWGAEPESVASGATAIERLSNASASRFEIAMIDMHMPGMNGLDLAYKIKALPNVDNMKLLALTSVGTNGQLPDDGCEEFDDSVSKPVRELELYNALATLLGASPAHETTAASGTNASDDRPIKARILIAEDNVVNQEVAIGMLTSLGCQTTVVGDGLEAVAAIEHMEFDLVLMDIQMPHLDGYMATEAIRGGEANRDKSRIPIVALTANAVKGDRERCIAAGMDDYLSKPFTQQSLRATLQRWIQPANAEANTFETDTTSAVGSAAEVDTGNDGECVLDEDVIQSLVELSPDGSNSIVVRVFQSYREVAPRVLEQIHEALEEEDVVALQRAAHSLKSSSANIGANELSSLFALLEKAADAETVKDVESVVGDIELEYDRVMTAMQVVLNRNAS